MSEDDILSKYKVPIFNGTNHKEWSTKMALALQIKCMWKYCDPKLLTKLTGSSSSTSKDTSEERMKCRALLLLSMDDLRRESLQDYEEPVEIWAKAAEVYKGSPAAEIVACASELFALSMEDGMPVEDYLAKYEVLNKRLGEHSVALPTSLLTACMLARVSNYYKPVATTLEALATKTEPLSWDKAKTLLISQASKRNTLGDGSRTAMYTSGRGSVAGRRVCSTCGSPRHTVENCWKAHPEKRKEWLEGQIKKASVAVKGRDSEPEEDSAEGEPKTSFAWMAAAPIVSKRSEWWVDCGASGHMSPFRDLFASYLPYSKPKYVRMGDGRPHRALGSGSIRITKGNGFVETLHNVDYVPELRQNLFSSGIMAGKGFQISAVYDGWTMRHPVTRIVEATAKKLRNNLYLMDITSGGYAVQPHLTGRRTVLQGRRKY
jgi:hypothetical protein